MKRLLGSCFLLLAASACGPSQAELNARAEAERQAQAARQAEAEARERKRVEAEEARRAEEERVQRAAAARTCIERSFFPPDPLRTAQEAARLVRQVNTAGCPPEHRSAYDAHMFAWSDYAEIKAAQKQLEEQAPIALVAEIVSRVSGSEQSPAQDYDQLASDLRFLAGDRSDRIESTYREIRRIALLYDVTPP